MPIRTGGTAPYSPSATTLQVINAYRDRGLVAPITEDVLTRAGVSDALAPRTLRALEGLELIDKNGMPTAEFEGLRRAPTEEFKQRLEAIIRSVYAEVFQFTDPAKDEPARIADAFRAYEPSGQRQRMITLFMGLCVAAGVVPENTAPKPRTPSPSAQKRTGWVQSLKKRGASFSGPAGTRVSGDELFAPDGAIPSGLVAILAMLPKNGAGWTAARRKQFMDLFGHALDFSIPIREAVATDDGSAGTDQDDLSDDDRQ